jgi:hypothetical protein
MRTTTYNDEAVPWSRSNHVLGTRSLPSSDDSGKNFTTSKSKTEIMVSQAPFGHWNMAVNCAYFLPCPNSLSI